MKLTCFTVSKLKVYWNLCQTKQFRALRDILRLWHSHARHRHHILLVRCARFAKKWYQSSSIGLSPLELPLRGVYSSKKSELFPSAKSRLSNRSPNSSPISKLQVPRNRGQSLTWFSVIIFILFFKIFIEGCIGRTQENFVFLKLESCNLVNTFGCKFRAGNELKKQFYGPDSNVAFLGEIFVKILLESLKIGHFPFPP